MFNRWISQSWWVIVADDVIINSHVLPYLLAHIISIFIGDELYALRYGSICLSILGIAFSFKLSKTWFNRPIAVVTAFLFAIAPVSLAYVHSFRGYTAVINLTLIAGGFAYFAITTNQWRYWLAFSITIIALIYSHVFTLLAWANMLLLIILGNITQQSVILGKRFIISVTLIMFGLAILYLPIALELGQTLLTTNISPQVEATGDDILLFQRPNDVASLFTNLAWFSYFRQTNLTLQAGFSLFALAGSLLLLKTATYRHKVLILWLYILFPFAQIWLISQLWADFWVRPVYMVFTYPAFILLVSVTIVALPQQLIEKSVEQNRLMISGLVFIIVILWYPVINYIYVSRTQGMLETGNYLQTQVTNNDLIVCLNWPEPNETSKTSCSRTLNFRRETDFSHVLTEIVTLYDLVFKVLPQAQQMGTLHRQGNVWLVIYNVPVEMEYPQSDRIVVQDLQRYGRTLLLTANPTESYLTNLTTVLTYLLSMPTTEMQHAFYQLMLGPLFAAQGNLDMAEHHLQQASLTLTKPQQQSHITRARHLADMLQPQPMTESVGANFGNQILWHGHTLPDNAIKAGEKVQFVFFWEALTKITENYSIFIHLRDEQDNIIGQFDYQPFSGSYPTQHWQPGQQLVETIAFPSPSEIPAGTHQLFAGFYNPHTMHRLPIINQDHADNALKLGKIVVTR